MEHDRNTIEMAEHIIDIGPKAGIQGGQIVYQGDLPGLLQCQESITGQYLTDSMATPVRTADRKTVIDSLTPCLTIRNARTNNLQDVTVSFPLGVFVGIAGVSGSGKSSLVSDTLIPLLKEYFHEQWQNGENGETDITENDDNNDDVELAMRETVADKLEGIEHIVLSSCDWIIELGPGAGTDGGRIIAEGSPQALKRNPRSVTGRYL